MSKHTPGPWQVEDYTINRTMRAIGTNKCTVAGAYAEADARLIAAAPDLLEALRALVADVDERDYKLHSSTLLAMMNAMRAIYKATGDTL